MNSDSILSITSKQGEIIMNHEEIKKEIKEIVSIVELVPTELKTKCFEILLVNFLTTTRLPQKEAAEEKSKYKELNSTFTLSASMKAFLLRNNITQEELKSVIMVENNEIHFIREPEFKSALKGQNDWALLIALKNGLLNDSLKADPEEVRSIVQDKGFYIKKNFSSYFKKEKYVKYFKTPLEPQGSSQQLSREGETALAELIKSLVNN